MSDRRSLGHRPVVLAIDHAFVGDDSAELEQGAYDALGALDAAAPQAICPLSAGDLEILVDASLRGLDAGESTSQERQRVIGAARRVRHVLERSASRVSLLMTLVVSVGLTTC